jgi:hypothetical protein
MLPPPVFDMDVDDSLVELGSLENGTLMAVEPYMVNSVASVVTVVSK